MEGAHPQPQHGSPACSVLLVGQAGFDGERHHSSVSWPALPPMVQSHQGFVLVRGPGQRTVSPWAWPQGLHGTVVGTLLVTRQIGAEDDKVNWHQVLPR